MTPMASGEPDGGPLGEMAASGVSLSRTARACAVLSGIAMLFWVLGSFVLELFLVVLIALLLRGMAALLARVTRLPVGGSLAVVVGGLTLLAGVGLYYRGPRFAHEMQLLFDRLAPEILRLRQHYAATEWGQFLQQHLMPEGGSGAAMRIPAMAVLGSTFGVFGEAVVVVLAAIYMAVSPDLYVRGLVLLFPLPARSRVNTILRDCGASLQWWMVGQGVSMLAVGIISTVGLLILGVPLPFSLGLLAGMLTFIPYVGAWLGSVPAILMAMTVGPFTALWAAGVFLLCHIVEGYLLAPLVQRRTTEMAPALTLLAMAVVGSFYGILGLILATPITAAALVAVKEGYIASILGDGSMRKREGAAEA
ncbi:AI-2E family transporter [Lichenicola cladoniae]|nr:AI-2E family transporter [Lichenicola cladoniae]